jgi:hypothetical protein
MGSNKVSHCFALNGNQENPQIYGIENIVHTYRENQSKIGLGGPTLFQPILIEFLNYLRQLKSSGAQAYNVILILTDGVINDMPDTKRTLV